MSAHPDRPTALTDALPGLAPITRAVTESVLRLPFAAQLDIVRAIAAKHSGLGYGSDKLLAGADEMAIDARDEDEASQGYWPDTRAWGWSPTGEYGA